MRVLLLETHPRAGEAASRAIEAAGHEVLRCHDPDQPAFPCNGMHGPCPVEHGVDVAFVVRAADVATPSPFEDGARCAARSGVPLVVAEPGSGVAGAASNPFADWTVATAPADDPVGALVAAVGEPNHRLSEAATAALRRRLQSTGVDPGPAWVRVHRRADSIRAVYAAPGPQPERHAVWVGRAIRELDPHTTVDVALAPAAT